MVAIKVMAGGYNDARAARAPTDTLAEIHQRRSAHVAALRWALRSPRIHTTSVSMHDRDQLEDNLQAMAAPFSDADSKTLAAHLDYLRRGTAACATIATANAHAGSRWPTSCAS